MEKRKEKRIVLDPADLISAEFYIENGSEKKQLWHLDVFDCSNHGLGLLVAEFDSALLHILNPEDRIEDMLLYSEWGIMKVNATVRHITKIEQGVYKNHYVVGVYSDEIKNLQSLDSVPP
ncbi:MAG: hypothetical protein HQ552_06845 [Desulfobacteraceae bacterium]|nr:hypothetical protein [Desulfobacteraceae bacterium]